MRHIFDHTSIASLALAGVLLASAPAGGQVSNGNTAATVTSSAAAGNTTAAQRNDPPLDRRVRSEERQYALTFVARAPGPGSNFGHAYIIWQREDDAKQMSVADAVGFHAVRENEATKAELIIGTPGHLASDALAQPAAKLTVLVNSDAYQRALDRKSEWERKDSTYKGFWNNCVTHVAAIAESIGLATTPGTYVTPLDYMRDLGDRNVPAEKPKQVPEAQAPVTPATPGPALSPAPLSAVVVNPRPAPRRPRNGPASIYDRGNWGTPGGGGHSGGGFSYGMSYRSRR